MSPRIPHLSLILTLLGASAASAHDFWLEPSSFRSAPGERVAIRMRVGERLVGEVVPRNPYAIVRFDLIDGEGRATPAHGIAGVDPAAIVMPAAPGLHWIVFQSERSGVELAPAKFAEYLAAEGLEKIAAERQRRGESARIAREAFSRSAKSALCVQGEGEGGGALAAQGLALELVAEKSPCALVAGSTASFRLLFRGQPLAGTLVQALRREGPDGAAGTLPPLSGRTDRAGRVSLKLDRPGFWLIKAVETLRAEAIPDVEWESFWASLTLELPEAP